VTSRERRSHHPNGAESRFPEKANRVPGMTAGSWPVSRAIGALLSLGACTACASASSEMIGPETYSVECRRSQANCYKEAASQCPQGFEVLDSSGRSKPVVTANGNSFLMTTKYRGELLVRCTDERRAADD
jgi:hypothetical protein